MPLTYRIDYERRIVIARAYGTLTDKDVFSYQRQAWSGKDVAGHDELVDMTDVSEIVVPSMQRVRDLASVAALMDLVCAPTRFAIVAPGDRAYELARVYQQHREREVRSTKDVRVFRSLRQALAFLGIKDAPLLPPLPPGAGAQK